MRHVIPIIKSIFLTAVNYILLVTGSILVVVGAVLGNLYIPVLATIPMLAVGLLSIPAEGFKDSIVVLGAIILVLVLIYFVFPILLTIYQILITVFGAVGAIAIGGGQGCLRIYDKNDDEINYSKDFVPRKTYFLFLPYFVLNVINTVIRYLLRMLFVLAIIVSVGMVGYSIYSHIVGFTDSIAMIILPKLEYFATDTVWGNYALGIMLLLTIIGTLVKSTSDIKFYLEELELEEYERNKLYSQNDISLR